MREAERQRHEEDTSILALQKAYFPQTDPKSFQPPETRQGAVEVGFEGQIKSQSNFYASTVEQQEAYFRDNDRELFQLVETLRAAAAAKVKVPLCIGIDNRSVQQGFLAIPEHRAPPRGWPPVASDAPRRP